MSGLPQSAVIPGVRRLVSKVPILLQKSVEGGVER
jgi:hypothetical protein